MKRIIQILMIGILFNIAPVPADVIQTPLVDPLTDNETIKRDVGKLIQEAEELLKEYDDLEKVLKNLELEILRQQGKLWSA